MKVAKHWVRETGTVTDKTGYSYALISWAGSNLSLKEARERALTKLEAWKIQVLKGEFPGLYHYQDRDQIKEELVSEHHNDQGDLVAAITRNRYGALVLNAANVLIADVDLPVQYPRPGLFRKLKAFFSAPEEDKTQTLRAEYLREFVDFQRNHPALTTRIYETAAGFRLIVLNRQYQPLDNDAQQVLEELKSDPLYIRLCRSQECFRARLTPKPWRCGFRGPPNQFPRETAERIELFGDWLNRYERQSAGYAVCRLVDTLGGGDMDDTARRVVELHDQYVLKQEAKGLA